MRYPFPYSTGLFLSLVAPPRVSFSVPFSTQFMAQPCFYRFPSLLVCSFLLQKGVIRYGDPDLPQVPSWVPALEEARV